MHVVYIVWEERAWFAQCKFTFESYPQYSVTNRAINMKPLTIISAVHVLIRRNIVVEAIAI